MTDTICEGNSLTINEAAKRLNMTYTDVLNCVNNGALESQQPADMYGQLLITEDSLYKFKENQDKNVVDVSKVNPDTKWVDTKTAASLLGINIGAVQRMLYNGQLREDKTRKKKRIMLEDVINFAKNNDYVVKGKEVESPATEPTPAPEEVVEEKKEEPAVQAEPTAVVEETVVEEPKESQEGDSEAWYTAKQIAELTGINLTKIYTAVRNGSLETVKRINEETGKEANMANNDMISRFIDNFDDTDRRKYNSGPKAKKKAEPVAAPEPVEEKKVESTEPTPVVEEKKEEPAIQAEPKKKQVKMFVVEGESAFAAMMEARRQELKVEKPVNSFTVADHIDHSTKEAMNGIKRNNFKEFKYGIRQEYENFMNNGTYNYKSQEEIDNAIKKADLWIKYNEKNIQRMQLQKEMNLILKEIISL